MLRKIMIRWHWMWAKIWGEYINLLVFNLMIEKHVSDRVALLKRMRYIDYTLWKQDKHIKRMDHYMGE